MPWKEGVLGRPVCLDLSRTYFFASIPDYFISLRPCCDQYAGFKQVQMCFSVSDTWSLQFPNYWWCIPASITKKYWHLTLYLVFHFVLNKRTAEFWVIPSLSLGMWTEIRFVPQTWFSLCVLFKISPANSLVASWAALVGIWNSSVFIKDRRFQWLLKKKRNSKTTVESLNLNIFLLLRWTKSLV